VSVIRWEEPPPAGGGNPGQRKPVLAHELIAVQLRQRPGDWALIHEQSSNPAIISEINHGKLRPYRPAGAYESVSRKVTGVFQVYARYVGNDAQDGERRG
jgi:hypothetical protein